MSKNNTCITIGFFDSFHLGHSKVIDTLVEKSKEHNLDAKVISLFDGKSLYYTSEDEKKYLLEKKDVFNIETCAYSEALDLEPILIEEGAKVLVVGENFNLNGIEINDLKVITNKINVTLVICKTVLHNGSPITMELVKEACRKNNLEEYAHLCGHPYIMIGTIVKGKQIGRTVGLPTANLSFEKNKILPELGVYSSVSHFGNEKFMGMTNIGLRPTVDDETKITVETYIIDFDRMVYGETCTLEVHFYTRGVIKFNSLQEVQQQVAKDITVSKKRLSDIFKK